MRRDKKILLLWYQQDDNFGDLLLYQTTKEYLENAGYCVESHEVGDSERKIAEHANQCGFMMFAGGGIIERGIPQVIRHIRGLRELLQVPYGVIGVGMGQFDYQEHTDALRYWVDQAAFFYVRDMATRNYLNGLYDHEKVVYSGDVVFGNRTIVKNSRIGNALGLNLRNIPYPDLQGEFEWHRIHKVLDNVKCSILIPDCNSQESSLGNIFDNLKDLREYKFLDQKSKIEKTISEIQKCNIVIAMRFHVVLVAALFGIVPIPILYCPKVRYLAEQLGIMELSVELGEWEQIPQKVDQAKRKKEEYLKKMADNVIILQKNVQEMYHAVMNTLEELRMVDDA